MLNGTPFLRTEEPYDVCVVGAGVAGALVAAVAARRGLEVLLVEAGERRPVEERAELRRRHMVMRGNPWKETVREDRDRYTDDSTEPYPLNGTRVKGVGGTTLAWGGVAQRLHVSDFETRSRWGTGRDWPIAYGDLEPYYGRAEKELGVAGDASEDAPPRSGPYPMPAFPDGHGDEVWRATARRMGIDIGPAPYAKNSVAYDGRPPCQMWGACSTCPIGAQYSADVHVDEALATGNCTLLAETVARRIETDGRGRVRAVHATTLDGDDRELEAREVVVAAHAVESARLLLLSDLGTDSGHLGRHLMEHWYVGGRGRREERTRPGRQGFHILESAHFYDRDDRDEAGAIKLEFSDGNEPLAALARRDDPVWGEDLAERECREFGRWLTVTAETEHQPRVDSRVTLDREVTDRFGDPVPRIRFALGDAEERTRQRAVGIIGDVLTEAGCSDIETWRDPSPAAHHMGTCRMSADPGEGVVDPHLRVHGTENLHVAGSSVFPTSGAVQPTLTIAALALRLGERLATVAGDVGGGA